MLNYPVVLYDGQCELCDSSVRFVKSHVHLGSMNFLPLEGSEAKRTLDEVSGENEIPDSIILIDKGKVFIKSDAVLRIATKLRFPYNLISLFFIFPRFVRDFFYDLIAANRKKWFGIKESCSFQENV